MKFNIKKIERDGKFIKIDVGSRFKAGEIIENIKEDKEYTCEIKQYRKKRSKSANAYFWELCNQLAEKLRIEPEELYRQMIKDVGGNAIVYSVDEKEKDKAKELWKSHGKGWIVEELGEYKGNVELLCYMGSSVYDTQQMSRLIDIAVEECKEQGIDVLSDRERSLLLEAWE